MILTCNWKKNTGLNVKIIHGQNKKVHETKIRLKFVKNEGMMGKSRSIIVDLSIR